MKPKERANLDYSKGLGQEANPYIRGTHESEQYAMQMGKLYQEELNEIMQGVRQ